MLNDYYLFNHVVNPNNQRRRMSPEIAKPVRVGTLLNEAR